MVKIGIIGAGAIAERAHIPSYTNMPEATVAAIASRTRERCERLADQFDIPQIYDDWRVMLEKEDLDAVSICTPTSVHCEMAVAAAQAGKHVLVEKPMAMTLEQADQMIDAADKAGVILMVSQSLRFSAVFQTIHQIIESGVIGRVETIRAMSGHGGGKFWSPEAKWFYDKSQVGGACLDMGIHEIDMVRFLAGSEVVEVAAFIDTMDPEMSGEIDDTGVYIIKFENGVLANLLVSWTFVPGFERSYAIGCQKGAIRTIYQGDHPLRVEMNEPPGIFYPEIPKESKYGPYGGYGHFVDCILTGKTPDTDGRTARASLEITLAGYQSSAEGKAVKLR